MREIEPAHVVALSYVISNDGASNTCAQLTLQLSDPGSALQGRTFEVDLPPATNGHAEFVIPQHRFLASVHRMWKRGDRCQVPCLLAALSPLHPATAVVCGPVLAHSGYLLLALHCCFLFHFPLYPCIHSMMSSHSSVHSAF